MNTIQVKGLPEVIRELKELEAKTRRRILRKALRQAGEVVKQEVINKAPVGQTGKLSDGIRLSVRFPDPFTATAKIIPGKKQFYAYFVEYGHKITRGRGKRAKVVGNAPARPFFRPAFDASIDKAYDVLANELESIVQEAGR